jgi:hypothetical protein
MRYIMIRHDPKPVLIKVDSQASLPAAAANPNITDEPI